MDVSQILYIIISAVVAAAVAALGAAIRGVAKRQSAFDAGMQAMLRAEIIRSYYHYAERGWITLHGLEAITQAYQAYHDLGGNGTVTKLVEDLQELPVREKEENEHDNKD